jgi:hypothetical protein
VRVLVIMRTPNATLTGDLMCDTESFVCYQLTLQILKVEATYSSETSVDFKQTAGSKSWLLPFSYPRVTDCCVLAATTHGAPPTSMKDISKILPVKCKKKSCTVTLKKPPKRTESERSC